MLHSVVKLYFFKNVFPRFRWQNIRQGPRGDFAGKRREAKPTVGDRAAVKTPVTNSKIKDNQLWPFIWFLSVHLAPFSMLILMNNKSAVKQHNDLPTPQERQRQIHSFVYLYGVVVFVFFPMGLPLTFIFCQQFEYSNSRLPVCMIPGS